mmetsp:Transcript_28146/g.76136  ORF Transcript_28146/g.76136 Transcript_28146/m.76136 type:complete len:235 (-) Transcript_28146:195-899(-)
MQLAAQRHAGAGDPAQEGRPALRAEQKRVRQVPQRWRPGDRRERRDAQRQRQPRVDGRRDEGRARRLPPGCPGSHPGQRHLQQHDAVLPAQLARHRGPSRRFERRGAAARVDEPADACAGRRGDGAGAGRHHRAGDARRPPDQHHRDAAGRPAQGVYRRQRGRAHRAAVQPGRQRRGVPPAVGNILPRTSAHRNLISGPVVWVSCGFRPQPPRLLPRPTRAAEGARLCAGAHVV